MVADYITTPFVLGIFRPRIYLLSSLSEQEQEYILRHEQYHIRRGDHIFKLLAYVALCIHWFNPLVWLAFLLFSKDMEMSCDEAVVLWAKGAKNIVLIPNLLLLLMFFGKFSTFTSGFAFCILFCIFDVLFRKNWKSIWLFLPGIILMPVCYLVYCPSIKNLFEYVAGILKISSGWMLTMQL